MLRERDLFALSLLFFHKRLTIHQLKSMINEEVLNNKIPKRFSMTSQELQFLVRQFGKKEGKEWVLEKDFREIIQ